MYTYISQCQVLKYATAKYGLGLVYRDSKRLRNAILDNIILYSCKCSCYYIK